MNLSHLKYVLEVERTGSISRAAQSLYMAQPNLSKAIRELESEIGITIFRRNSKGVKPTQKGMEFLSYARNIAAQMDELESLYKPNNEYGVELSFSAPRASYVSFAFAEFASRYHEDSQINIRFKETSSMNAVSDVASGESDFAIVRWQKVYEDYYLHLLTEQGLEHQLLWEFKMVLVMSKEHPLAVYEDIPYHMLSGYTEILHGDFQVPSLSISEINKNEGMTSPAKRIYVYDRGSQLELLRHTPGTYLWVAPIPQEILDGHNLVLRRCGAANMVNRDVVVYPKAQPPTGLCAELIAEMRRVTQKLHKE